MNGWPGLKFIIWIRKSNSPIDWLSNPVTAGESLSTRESIGELDFPIESLEKGERMKHFDLPRVVGPMSGGSAASKEYSVVALSIDYFLLGNPTLQLTLLLSQELNPPEKS